MMSQTTFIITGMHCTSCAMNIDLELEDTEGVQESSTNYAKALTQVTFDTKKVSEEKIVAIIKRVGYTAVKSDK